MRKDKKPWGECLHAFGGKVEVDIIDVKAGGYSSVHYHADKDNLFVLLSGAMDVLSFGDGDDPDYGLCGYKSLVQLRERGDTVVSRAGEWHQFKVVEDAVVVEVYYVDIDPLPGDIERSDTNGMMTLEELAAWMGIDR